MAVEAGLDTGGIYAEQSTVIGDEETAEELRSRLVAIGSALLAHLDGGIAGLPPARDQVGSPSYAEKIQAGELRLHWDRPALQVRRVVRLGRAWTTFRGRRLTVLSATGPEPSVAAGHVPGPATGAGPGSLDGAEVMAGDGHRVVLVTVQPEGRRAMAAADWLRGVRPGPGERLGD
jgi:methionyl-tRNA formyltransferase